MFPNFHEVLRAIPVNRDTFNNWVRRKLVPIKAPKQRGAWQLDRHAALHIAFMGALTDTCLDASVATREAAELVNKYKAGELPSMLAIQPPEWTDGPCSKLPLGPNGRRVPLCEVAAMFANYNHRFGVIDIDKIVGNIEAVFETEEG